MADFDPPIYIKSPHPEGDVIVFGKAPELELADSANGVARFGGQWRSPSYFQAYLRAAGVLVNHGVNTNTLDDIGLPAFYLQRHALELLVKRLLSWMYEYADAVENKDLLSEKQRKRLNNSHKISVLLEDLRTTCENYGFPLPPYELGELVKDIEGFEGSSETWARYATSERKDGVLHHAKDETVVPLVTIQRKLEDVVFKVVIRSDGTETYEDELYDAWSKVTGATD